MHFLFGPCSCNCQRPERPPGVASNVCCGWVLWMPGEWLEKRQETSRLLLFLTYFCPSSERPKVPIWLLHSRCYNVVCSWMVLPPPTFPDARQLEGRYTSFCRTLLWTQESGCSPGPPTLKTQVVETGKARAHLEMQSGRFSSFSDN